MRTYHLVDTEVKKKKKFQKKHHEKCDSGTRVIFTDTGIGTKVEIQCLKCNKIKDISDYSIW